MRAKSLTQHRKHCLGHHGQGLGAEEVMDDGGRRARLALLAHSPVESDSFVIYNLPVRRFCFHLCFLYFA